jgi:hypothetical protein
VERIALHQDVDTELLAPVLERFKPPLLSALGQERLAFGPQLQSVGNGEAHLLD